MKIVDVCAFFAPLGGGVKTYVERKLAAAPSMGHELVVLAPGAEHQTIEVNDAARIVYLPAHKFPLDRRYRYFAADGSVAAALDAERPDLVEVASPWRSAEMVAAWRGSAPKVMVMHCDPLSAYAYRWFGPVASEAAIDRSFAWYWRHLRKLDAAFDGMVSASESLTMRMREGGLTGVVTNPMGVEPGLFSPAARDEALRARLLERCGLGPDATLLIGLGRHAPEKRWPMVIDASVAAGWQHPLGLIMIGEGRETPKIARHIGGNPHVQLLAPERDRATLARILASSDALIHGCEAETFCMVAAEARAAGLPIIAPDRGGAADQARTGGGEVYRSGDAADAADAIVRLIDTGLPKRRAAIANQARDVRTMDAHFRDLFAYYEGLRRTARRAA